MVIVSRTNPMAETAMLSAQQMKTPPTKKFSSGMNPMRSIDSVQATLPKITRRT